MATITITRTISAPHLARAVTALRAHYGLPASATGAQVQAAWETESFARLKGIVKDYERRLAADSAADAVSEIDLT